MADPQIDNCVRAQCIWKGASGLPEDRFVTTWAFQRETLATNDAAQQSAEVNARLLEFWSVGVEGGNALATFVPADIVLRGLEVRTYDLGQAPPREPTVYQNTVPVTGATNALPREVAVCLSFYAERNLPKRRGRVFIGPLGTNALQSAADTSVAPALRTALAAAAERLVHGLGLGDEMRLSVLSPTDGDLKQVTAGWVDNAFDTQRRRGLAPTARTLWPTP